jgi:hypothetical protein
MAQCFAPLSCERRDIDARLELRCEGLGISPRLLEGRRLGHDRLTRRLRGRRRSAGAQKLGGVPF